MRFSPVIILFSLIISCTNHGFEREFYESVSGLPTPLPYQVVETVDNAEFVTITTLSVDSASLRIFLTINDFSLLKSSPETVLLAGDQLKNEKPEGGNAENLFYNSGMKGNNIWVYLADIKRNLLWMEIRYTSK